MSALRRQEDDFSPGSAAGARQRLRREINEQIEHLVERMAMIGPLAAFCECGNPDCAERIDIGEDEYEAVRRFPTRFLVKPGHDHPEDERVVEAHKGYVVTEKVGESCLPAILFDPRKPARTRSEPAGRVGTVR